MADSKTRTDTVNRHDLNDAGLGNYLIGHLPNLQLPVKSTKIGYGQSNPTYFVDDAAGTRFILRKRPSGTIISPVAHQIDREYRVINALGKVEGFPVPKVYCFCKDTSIIGTTFYVMEFVKGRIITDPDLRELSPSDRRKAWFSMIETLAWLHSINPDSIGLRGFGKTENFYLRHCNTFSRVEADQAKVRDIKTGEPLGRAHPNFDEVIDFIRTNLPSERSSIVHGDYKFDNVILHPTEPKIIAILDWELSTIGHPLMDVCYVVSPYWSKVQNPIKSLSNPAVNENLATEGMPDQDELLQRYADITGWDARKDKFEVAKVFHLMRGATISHGIQARTVSGQASSEFSHIYFENTKRSLDDALLRAREIKSQQSLESKL
ncbi:kinase-like protein [Tothia fuscella]|uniref:Kinase-like protein n=1 Tax=Tothia fuscella TaxID=1048955 RepID=A0A9P4TTU8_9PEZI|nr:kinase-like protein [Tothia fuscella]